MRELDEVLRDLKYGLTKLKQARPTYDEAEAYYIGDDPELFLSDALRLYLRDSVAAFRLNMASVAVDVVCDRLFISAITSPDARTQKEIDKIILENDFWAWSNDAIRESEMFGDEYIGVWEGADGRPILSPLDPRSTRVIYDSELERIPEFLVRWWEEDDRDGNKFERATISYFDEIYKFYRDSATSEWSEFEVEGEPWPLPNVMQDLPVGHLRNAFPYGRPGHSKSYGMQQVITKTVLNMVANIDFMGFRQRYATKNADQAQAAGVPTPAPRSKDGTRRSLVNTTPRLTAGPGKLWEIIAETVGEFSPTDAKQFTDLITECIVNMARAERLSARKYGIDGSGQQPSGESQAQDDRSLRDRVAAGRRSRGGGVISAFKKALAIVGIFDAEINIDWERDDVTTDKDQYEIALQGIQIIAAVKADPTLRPWAVLKFMEWGYSMQEIDSFLPLTPVGPTSEPTNTTNQGELDSADEVE